METFLLVAWIVTGAALVRQALGLVALGRYLARARVASIPRGPTPPLSLLRPLPSAAPEPAGVLEATLRQNYPDFEVILVQEGDEAKAVADEVAARVPDVPVRRIARGETPEPSHGLFAVADAAVYPDPLYLRDIANGLAEADAVSFPPIAFGMRTFWGRVGAILLDTETLLSLLLRGARAVTSATIGVRREALQRIGGAVAIGPGTDRGAVLRRAGLRLALARRAARLFTPGAGFREALGDARRRAREVRSGAPALLGVELLLSAAPLLLLAAAVAGAHPAAALLLLALHTAVRAAVAVLVDFRFCWDRSLLRAIPLLPLLWVFEPLVLLAAALPGGRATLMRATDGGRAG